MKKIILSALCALAVSTVAFAQQARERPAPGYDDVIAHLGLSDSQIACLETNKDSAREAAAPFAEQLRDLTRTLRQAARNGEDVASIQSEIDAVRSSLQAVRSSHVTTAQSCLDVSQAAALGELIAAATLQQEVRQGASLLLIESGDGEGRSGGFSGRRNRRGGPRR